MPINYRFASLLLVAGLVYGQVSVVHNDPGGTATNSAEPQLTPANVAAGLRLLGSYTVDQGVFGQVLYVPNVSNGAGAFHDLVITETTNNSLYAFDATLPGSAYIWKSNFGATNTSYQSHGTTNQYYDQGFGCWSTPVVDTASSVLYVVCGTSSQTWILRKINLSDGSTAASVTISGSVTGTGDPGGSDCVSGGVLSFCPAKEFQRPGIKLSQGNVYVSFGGVGDQRPYHGWIMAYNSSLVQQGIFCTTPNGWGGAPWGGEPTFDAAGHVFITTGNGTDQNGATGTYTDSVLALSSTLSFLGVWTPSNNVTINAADADTSANRVIILPNGTLAATGSKDFNVYILDPACLVAGGSGTSCQLQTFKTNAAGSITAFSGAYGATFMNSVLFLPTTAGSIYAFTCSGSGATTCNTTPLFTQTNSYGFPGPAQMSGSCNGTSNCILWVTTPASSTFTSSPVAGTLRAINPVDGTEYWNSGSSLGNISKFAAPTIASGRVFVATQDNKVQVFGLIPSMQISGSVRVSGQTTIQ